MKIELGAQVTTADGHEIGKIDKVVLDPERGDIHSIIIHKGMLFGKDIEIPLDEIGGQQAGMIQTKYTKAQVDELPGFQEGSYTTPPPDRSTEYATGYGYPIGSVLWPSTWDVPVTTEPYGHEATGDVGDEVAAMQMAQDLGNSVVKEGSDVRSRDGEKVGEVHQMIFDSKTGRPTTLVIRKGFLFTEDIEVPAGLISSIDDDRVYLDARHDELQRYLKHPAR